MSRHRNNAQTSLLILGCSYGSLVARYIVAGERFNGLRNVDGLSQVERGLSVEGLSKECHAVGFYFKALLALQTGHAQEAERLFVQALKDAPEPYRARILAHLAVISEDRGDWAGARVLWAEAVRIADTYDPYTVIEATRARAIELSLNGDHQEAAAILEDLTPIVRHIAPAYPHIFYKWMNSLAVEFGYCGRLSEAKKLSDLTISSPFAQVNPEFRETNETINTKLSEQPGRILAFTPRIDEGRIRREASEYVSRNFLQPQFPLREIQRIRGDVRAIAAAGGR